MGRHADAVVALRFGLPAVLAALGGATALVGVSLLLNAVVLGAGLIGCVPGASGPVTRARQMGCGP